MVQAAQEVNRSPRLSDVLFPNVARNFSTIAGVPSNIQAVETGLMFANANTNFVALVGPSGWGKTHLMEAIARAPSSSEQGHISEFHREQAHAANPGAPSWWARVADDNDRRP